MNTVQIWFRFGGEDRGSVKAGSIKDALQMKPSLYKWSWVSCVVGGRSLLGRHLYAPQVYYLWCIVVCQRTAKGGTGTSIISGQTRAIYWVSFYHVVSRQYQAAGSYQDKWV